MKSEIIIAEARKEIGYKEIPAGSNKTKFGEWFGLNKVAWCGIFVSYIYHKAGCPLGNIGYLKGYAGCQTAVAHFRKTGEVVKWEDARPGDIVFFDWNGDGKFDHTGILLEKTAMNQFDAIEGNTAIGNDSNGGEVMLRHRSYSGREVFVRPKVAM